MKETPHTEAHHDKGFRTIRHRGREAVLKFLYQLDAGEGDWEQEPETRRLFWEQFRQCVPVSSDRMFAKIQQYAEKLLQCVLEHRVEIDDALTRHTTNWTLTRMSVIDRNIMRLAAAEVLFLSDIPAKVSVDEAVELAKTFGDKDSPRFVNGVLDTLLPRE